MLAALAAATTRIRLGPLVASTAFHTPAMLAKLAATVDEISGGRLVLGLGAGWNEPEFRAFGFPFDHRIDRFEEAFTIVRTLLQDGAIDFDGRYFQARDCRAPAATRAARRPAAPDRQHRASDAPDHAAPRPGLERLVRGYGEHAGRPRAASARRRRDQSRGRARPGRDRANRRPCSCGCQAGRAGAGSTRSIRAAAPLAGLARRDRRRASGPTPGSAWGRSSSSSIRSRSSPIEALGAGARGPRPGLERAVAPGASIPESAGNARFESRGGRRAPEIVARTSSRISTSGSSSTSSRTVAGRSPRSPLRSASPRPRCGPARTASSSAASCRSSGRRPGEARLPAGADRDPLRAGPDASTSAEALAEHARGRLRRDHGGPLRHPHRDGLPRTTRDCSGSSPSACRRIDGVRDTETFSYLRLVKQTYQFGTR